MKNILIVVSIAIAATSCSSSKKMGNNGTADMPAKGTTAVSTPASPAQSQPAQTGSGLQKAPEILEVK